MATVFLLWHIHRLPSGEDDEKLIGVYATQKAAQAAIFRLGRQPGFVDCPEGFFAEAYEVDKDHWEEGYTTDA